MDLLKLDWLKAGRADRMPVMMSVSDVTDTEILDLALPRPDFQGAAYQFLIGLLQTAFAPRDRGEWEDRLVTPPSRSALERAFEPWCHAFLLENPGGPAFLQDLNLEDGRQATVDDLIFEYGSASGEHFSKPPKELSLCARCVALALATLQFNASGGGRGTRASVRKAGPVTTLVLPANDDAPLWERIWLNVIPLNELAYPAIRTQSDVLPWLAPTRRSDGPNEVETTPESVHPMQAYWSMSRRIRLDWSDASPGACSVCGEAAPRVLHKYRTRHGGVNYEGVWVHPLTPYKLDPKGQKPPSARAGQAEGLGYRDWLALTYGTDDHHPTAAVISGVVRSPPTGYALRIWAFAGDFENGKMKLRAWYDSTMPLYAVAAAQRESFVREISCLIDAALAVSRFLGDRVRQAWGTDTSEPAVRQSLWENTEEEFYRAVQSLAKERESDPSVAAGPLRSWLRSLRRHALQQFDRWAASGPVGALDLERVVKARGGLLRDLHRKAPLSQLWKYVRDSVEAA